MMGQEELLHQPPLQRPVSSAGQAEEDLGKGFNTNHTFPINKTIWDRMWARARVAIPDGRAVMASLQDATGKSVAPPVRA